VKNALTKDMYSSCLFILLCLLFVDNGLVIILHALNHPLKDEPRVPARVL
jgi:hypothetical protein